MDESTTDPDKLASFILRDKAVAVMFAIAILLIVLDFTAAALLARYGLANIGLLRIAMFATGAFALAGIALGLVRSIRSGRAAKNRAA